MLKVSEAASIALHTMAYLAERLGEICSTNEIAEHLGVSEAHLAKVLQRLVKAGLVRSTRGPKGGFLLAKPPEEVTLLEIYELIDGPLIPTTCLLNRPVCDGRCILGGLLGRLDTEVRDQLSGTTLSTFTGAPNGAGILAETVRMKK